MFTTVILRFGAFSNSISISGAEMALAVVILMAVYKVYKTRDYSILKKFFFVFLIMMVIAETISTFAGVDPKKLNEDL